MEDIHTVHHFSDMVVDDKEMWTESLALGTIDETINYSPRFDALLRHGIVSFLHQVAFLPFTNSTGGWWMVVWHWDKVVPMPEERVETR